MTLIIFFDVKFKSSKIAAPHTRSKIISSDFKSEVGYYEIFKGKIGKYKIRLE